MKKTAFFSGTPNIFGPSYFEAALVGIQWYLLPYLILGGQIIVEEFVTQGMF